ncbi:nicotinate-nucleotide--dimethylbenzimidazole phosphoribosyltransferase [Thiomicrorhabdus immobilis]|uniref:Nicotinate-nucleotide--dimethylbenzimidazole phosphoribosyltransferase n=1 Tax=Thiomicrorhabdus immobilis TaxID=2791037 RepID=A0ABN6CVV4_9GAMM|nr:nicotinate-nucleotide--dimethylbenzimidazole phosphoribosyltransferase [Thiomicrorhabdus immobilis]BCN93190.1 nicotinate-nucleotide--dimethylbenzimidazole phosphoribosyltransferase [Thiomicrorhabdus immobilis]
MKPIDTISMELAQQRQNSLTKPPGSLGQLEAIAIQLAACQGTSCPQIKQPWISVFAADHGITEEGVSAFPAVVTQEMVKNFSAGGAAITVISKQEKAYFEVVDVGVFNDVSPLPNLVSERVAPGSFNFAQQPAMNQTMLAQAMQVGKNAVARALSKGADLFIAGEMGIGNTSSAAVIISQLCQLPLANLVGRGTGVNDEQLLHKYKVLKAALNLHQADMQTPEDVLRCIGGLEIAALTGAYLECAREGLPMVVDGVIACAAALLAYEMQPAVKPWMLFGHQSIEPAQQAVFKHIDVTPILDLEMRLGEGSGAAMALPIIRLACALHANMATFEEAQVSDAH